MKSAIQNQSATKRRFSPWLLAAVLGAVLLLLIFVGRWRSTSTGAQVQVPMFYDAHYLYPRPWTQAQTAPGAPPPAPLAFYGLNSVSQPFVSGSPNLSMLEIWLAGSRDTAVSAALSDNQDLIMSAEIPLTQGEIGGYYRLALPPRAQSKGQVYTLSLSAPAASEQQPVVTRSIGGDRLGGALHLNEYGRPGNLELYTYASGLPGRWWLAALGEQILPAVFRLRLQQYKPQPFRGAFFTLLLLATAVLSGLLLVLAAPTANPSLDSLQRALGWSVVALLALILLWQLGSGRLRLPLATPVVVMQPASEPLQALPPDAPRLINDLTAVLWTAARLPEARFVHTEMLAGLPAVRTPADSRLSFALDVPRNGRFRAGITAEGAGELAAQIRLGDEILAQEVVTAVANPAQNMTWFELDLSPWAGQATVLHLETSANQGAPQGIWLMPQLSAAVDWLLHEPLPDDVTFQPVSFHFGEGVELVGFSVEPDEPQAGEPLSVKLFWRVNAPVDAYGAVFVHLLGPDGAIQAQHDAQPVANTYPIPNWRPGVVIVDEHTLQIPKDAPNGNYALAVGVYDPVTLERWPIEDAGGTAVRDARALLTTNLEVVP